MIDEIILNECEVHFWKVVDSCLTEFHGKSFLKRRKNLYKKIMSSSIEERQLFCHNEPFDIACNISGKELDVRNYLARYIEIRDIENPI